MQTEQLLAQQAILTTIYQLCRAFDEQDWALMRACLAETIDTDYASLRGTLPTRISADEYIRLRQRSLEQLRTQHLCLTPIIATEGEQASCRCNFIIHRWPADHNDQRFFHSYGYYEYRLIRVATAWQISSIKQVVLRNEGDATLHRGVPQAVQASDNATKEESNQP